MQYEKVIELTNDRLNEGEELVGTVRADYTPSFAWWFVTGPLMFIRKRTYILQITDKAIYFHRLSLLEDEIEVTDRFDYEEILKSSLKKKRLKLTFINKRIIFFNVMKFSRKRTAKIMQNDEHSLNRLILTDELETYIKERGIIC